MDLPLSVVELGAQLRGEGKISPDPALWSDPQVFAAERERIFQRSVLAIDHQTRLAEDGRWFRCDAAPRSLLLTRTTGGRLHALRNVCIHAGYPVCDSEEEGEAERLVCPYHGWEYALDGRLVEPELSSRIDPARLRLPSYSVCVRSGVIFVGPSGADEAIEQCASAVPAWMTAATVARRTRYNTDRNWKSVRYFLQSSPQLFLDGPADCHEFGPLSLVFAQPQRAVLLRIVPKFAEQTDVHVIEIADGDGSHNPQPSSLSDGLIAQLHTADNSLSWFGRDIARWYWSLMAPGE
ncbi:MAG: Rieske (2Fe-2S) protein [Alphaproteobacteria bacterium]|nr:Rieske (2Fe-2S) protein [Alphaproteobacteria bacterium]MBV9198639.1 Rieske (2Fe-2S) protein [Alphaproteobacteria bacterium]MBV9376583.1 Rieske (2Fe-2S) protein [Alphaproteobacteria bacterium]